MDLLFKNPPYFFETYFSFSPIEFIITFIIVLAVHILLCRKRFSNIWARVVFIIISSLYFSVLIGMTLLGKLRDDEQLLSLDPIKNISDLFRSDLMRTHQLRAMKSNTLLFIPCGVLSAVYFKRKKILSSIVFGATVSVIIELVQFVLHRGCAETMDVICNTLGATIGALITILICFIINKFSKRKT